MINNNYKIGIMGGMGPLATTIFFKKVIDYTDAKTDQENVNMVILNDTDVPDRTDYLLDHTKDSPLPYLLNDIEMLERLNCEYVTMTCNTAHFFYDELTNKSKLKFINMISETLKECKKRNLNTVGLLATRGTISTKIYDMFNEFGITIVTPNEEIQSMVDDFIYDKVKKNKPVAKQGFNKVYDYFLEHCDGIILGCTELSVIIDNLDIHDRRIVDSTRVIAKKIVEVSGKKLIDIED